MCPRHVAGREDAGGHTCTYKGWVPRQSWAPHIYLLIYSLLRKPAAQYCNIATPGIAILLQRHAQIAHQSLLSSSHSTNAIALELGTHTKSTRLVLHNTFALRANHRAKGAANSSSPDIVPVLSATHFFR